MSRSIVAISGLIVATIFGLTEAGSIDDRSPEMVVSEAIKGYNSGNYDEYTKAMHPDALRQFRVALVTLIEASDKKGKAEPLLAIFPKIRTVAELKQLDDRAFFAAYMRGVTERDPNQKKMMLAATVQTLGHVDESKDLAYVLYRMKTKVDGVEQGIGPLVVTVRKDGDLWAMMLAGDIETMTTGMLQAANGKIIVPDRSKSRIEPIGHILEGEGKAVLVYRVVMPFGESTTSKLNVLEFNKESAGWNAVITDDKSALIKLIKDRFEL